MTPELRRLTFRQAAATGSLATAVRILIREQWEGKDDFGHWESVREAMREYDQVEAEIADYCRRQRLAEERRLTADLVASTVRLECRYCGDMSKHPAEAPDVCPTAEAYEAAR